MGHEAQFCRINDETRSRIAAHFVDKHIEQTPNFLQLTLAEKSLCNDSYAPTLSIDATLPQNRPSSAQYAFKPAQGDFPVWYFFDGPLADPKKLFVILRLTHNQEYHPSTVRDGRLLSWNALTDANGRCSDEVLGKAFLVHHEGGRIHLIFRHRQVRSCAMQYSLHQQWGVGTRFDASIHWRRLVDVAVDGRKQRKRKIQRMGARQPGLGFTTPEFLRNSNHHEQEGLLPSVFTHARLGRCHQ